MGKPDVSLELGTEAVVLRCFDSVAPLLAFGVLAAAARVAAGAAVFAVVPFALVFTAGLAADFTLFFTVVLDGFATAFVAGDAVFFAGFRAFAIVLVSLLATVFSTDFFAGVAVFFVAADLVTLLAAVLFVADLVTVAFIISSMIETPETCPFRPKTIHSCSQAGPDSIGRRARHMLTHIAKRLPPLLELTSNPQ